MNSIWKNELEPKKEMDKIKKDAPIGNIPKKDGTPSDKDPRTIKDNKIIIH